MSLPQAVCMCTLRTIGALQQCKCRTHHCTCLRKRWSLHTCTTFSCLPSALWLNGVQGSAALPGLPIESARPITVSPPHLTQIKCRSSKKRTPGKVPLPSSPGGQSWGAPPAIEDVHAFARCVREACGGSRSALAHARRPSAEPMFFHA